MPVDPDDLPNSTDDSYSDPDSDSPDFMSIVEEAAALDSPADAVSALTASVAITLDRLSQSRENEKTDRPDVDPDAPTPAELQLSPGDYVPPWTRQADESDRAFLYFSHYRDLPLEIRTVNTVAEHFGVHPNAIYSRYHKAYRWKDRAISWDRHQDLIYQTERARAIRDMADRHADKLVEAIEGLAAVNNALASRIGDPDFVLGLSGMSPRAIVQLAVDVNKVLPSLMTTERLTRGMPSEVIEIHHEETVTHEFDADQLAEVVATLGQAGAWDGTGAIGGSESPIDVEAIEVLADESDPETNGDLADGGHG